ncbi:hypothetical protein BVRB_8g189160 [Beta vulgaris subsp. vulgaris]|nr:hypothetical protein BVRB_8g189160 [Beta vulgaris subsp. vulgaris]
MRDPSPVKARRHRQHNSNTGAAAARIGGKREQSSSDDSAAVVRHGSGEARESCGDGERERGGQVRWGFAGVGVSGRHAKERGRLRQQQPAKGERRNSATTSPTANNNNRGSTARTTTTTTANEGEHEQWAVFTVAPPKRMRDPSPVKARRHRQHNSNTGVAAARIGGKRE